jgi:hypothetical protein
MDRLKPNTAAWYRRQYIHSHNMNFGGVNMMRVWADRIQRSSSVTVHGQDLALQILKLSMELERELHTRVGP